MKKILLVTLISIVSLVALGQTTPEEMQKIINDSGFDWQAAWAPYSNMSAEELRGLAEKYYTYGREEFFLPALKEV